MTPLLAQKQDSGERQLVRFFESATIDWCEENYIRQYFIAEYWNAFAASLVALYALYLMRIAYAVRAPQTIFMVILAMWFKGMASFAVHSTLKYQFQVLDELPLILLNLSGLYCILTRLQVFSGYRRLCLMVLLISIGLFQAGVHSILPYTWVRPYLIHQQFSLVSNYLTNTVLICSFFGLIHVISSKDQCLKPLKEQFFVCQVIYLLALVCWVTDRFYCKDLNRVLNWSPQIHALYLILMGYYIYSMVFLLINCTFVEKYSVNILLFQTPLKWIPMASRNQLELAKNRILELLNANDQRNISKAIKQENPEKQAVHYQWTLDPWSKLIDYETAFSNYPKMYKVLTGIQIMIAILFSVLLFI